MLLGTLIVPIIVLEAPSFLPTIGYPGLIDAIEWMIVGLAWMGFLLVRPRGLLPERRYRAPRPAAGVGARRGLAGWVARMFTLGRPELAPGAAAIRVAPGPVGNGETAAPGSAFPSAGVRSGSVRMEEE
jgi:hypothetical protein